MRIERVEEASVERWIVVRLRAWRGRRAAWVKSGRDGHSGRVRVERRRDDGAAVTKAGLLMVGWR